MHEELPSVRKPRAARRKRAVSADPWQAILNDPALLAVEQYEVGEPAADPAAAPPLSSAPEGVAEPTARAELDTLIAAASYQAPYRAVELTATVSAGESEVTLRIEEDSRRARQVRRARPARFTQLTVPTPRLHIGTRQTSVHIVDLRSNLGLPPASPASEPVAAAVPQRRAERAEDDFFLRNYNAPAAPRATQPWPIMAVFETMGRGAWLYALLVGQVLASGPRHMGETFRLVARGREAAWRQTVKPSFTFALIAVLAVAVPLLGVRWIHRVVADSNHIAATGENGIKQLQSGLAAAADMDFKTATAELRHARALFAEAGGALAAKPSWLFQVAKLLPGSASAGGYAQSLVGAGEALAAGGEQLSKALVGLQLNGDRSLTEQLVPLRQEVLAAQQSFTKAQYLLQQVPVSAVPPEHAKTFATVQRQLPAVVSSLAAVADLTDFTYRFLGGEGPKTYLVLSQNPNELRGTGGFLGGLALLRISGGRIEQLAMPGGGTYDTEGAMKVKFVAPKPLRLLRDGSWYLWDANWWPDGPTSLDKIEMLWKNSDGTPVDGVLTVSAVAFADLLAVTGPIPMPEYGKTITSENFIAQTQSAVEVEYDREVNKPKQFLADLTPKLLEKLFALRGPALLPALTSLGESLAQRHILLRLHDDELQNRIHVWGWDGAVRQTSGDYLMVVDSNVGGGKTDGVIAVEVNHRAEVQVDGSIIDTVRITRTHQGIPGDPFTGTQNVDYLRLYVPEGAELLAATGFNPEVELNLKPPPPGAIRDAEIAATEDKALRDESSGTRITREFSKTVFANWIVLPVGESRTIELRYRLPQRLWGSAARADWLTKLLGGQASPYGTYQLLVQPQPGTTDRNLTHELLVPAGSSLIWSQGSPSLDISTSVGSLQAHGVVQTELVYGAILYRGQE